MYNSEMSGLQSTNGLCTLCQKRAEWICQRCMDLYCSSECQRKDWQRHRYICFSMPGLIPAARFTIEPPETFKNQGTLPNGNQMSNCLKEAFPISGQLNILPQSIIENDKLPHLQGPFEPVILLGFVYSNRCMVRPLKDTDAHVCVMNKIDILGKKAPRLNIRPSTHSIALSLLNGIMSRVEVLSIHNERRIKVIFYDYGVIASIDISDLRVATEDILSLPRYSAMVKLRNVSKYSVDENVKFFKKFEGTDCEMCNIFMAEGEIEVELISLIGNNHINKEIEQYYSNMNIQIPHCKSPSVGDKEREANGNTPAPEPNKDELLVDLSQDEFFHNGTRAILKPLPPKCIEELEIKTILTPPFDIYIFKPEMMNFKVVVLDTSALSYGYIGCIAETDLKYLVAVQEYLTKYKDDTHFYSPKLHEYCLARFENEWYRARVVKVIDQKRYAVVYLDFTNESILTSQDIRHYPVELNGPCRTNLCLIDGLPKSLNSAHINFLKKEITTESKLLIDMVKDVVQQIVVVQCNNVIKKMNTNGLI